MKRNLVAILSIFLLFIVFGNPSYSPHAEEPTVTSTNESILIDIPENGPGFELSPDIPDTKEVREVIKAVEKSYDVEVKAAYTFDISKFPTIYINDPRFPVSPGTLETIRQLTLNPEIETAGWLDYKIAYYSWMRDTILFSEAIHEKAKAENRELTKEERQSLIDPQGRTAPARAESPDRTVPITYLTVDINGDIAVVTLLRGVYHSELTLVLVDKNWYVANERFLSISP